ncbi:MAG: L,D-transpeptidase [Verrucomicrobiota bacterium]
MNPKEGLHLFVSVGSQVVDLKQGEAILWSAPVSTAKKGLGELEGSHQTPRGWFKISEKIGDQLPLGSVLKSRKPTGIVWNPTDPRTNDDLILSRILWLEGIEEKNLNTKNRYIYFHGTNQEHLIGTPASHGCIRLSNDSMIRLFNQVDVGTLVWIGM